MENLTPNMPKKQTFSRNRLNELMQYKGEVCITLMMPTHPLPPQREGDPIQFKQLLNQLKNELKTLSMGDHLDLIAPLEGYIQNRDFWNQQKSGLAIWISKDHFEMHHTPFPLPLLTIVSDSFHIKPIYRYFQENERMHILALNLDGVKLYEGNHFELDIVDLSGKVPLSMKDALGEELTDDHYNTASATGNGSNKQANQTTGNVVHGYMEKSQEQETDAERFFRMIDQEIYKHYSGPTAYPLLLAALPEHHHLFRAISKNEHLMEAGLQMNASQLTSDQLKEKLQEIFAAQHARKLDELLEQQALALSQKRSSTDLEEIATAALDGKIDTLLIEENKVIKGRILEDERRIEWLEHGVDDVLDDLSALVIDRGGKVWILPAQKIPGGTGVASIHRY
jgi:hypothetical protein